MSFLYLLHFTEPLHHAKHYLGSSDNVLIRLRTHAIGRGAKITRYLHSAGLEWNVAALFIPVPHAPSIKEIERLAKRSNNGPRFCPICNPDGWTPPAFTIDYPVSELGSLINSLQLRG